MSVKVEINKKDYLKKYLSKDDKKKKKKKKVKALPGRVKIIDDDLDFQIFNEAAQEDLMAANEDAPQIVDIIDERPLELRMDEFKKGDEWTTFTVEDEVRRIKGEIKDEEENENNDYSPVQRGQYPENLSEELRENLTRVQIKEEEFSDDENSRRDSISPEGRRKQYDNRDKSPQRRSDDSSPPRKKQNYSASKKRKEDYSPERRNEGNTPPRRKRYSASPPRRRDEKDKSPQRRSDDSRKKQSDLNNISRIRTEDNSPPRRRNDRDSSPPRRKNERGSSPPRRRNERNSSPPSKSNDISPPTRKRNYSPSPPRRGKEDDDHSPPRRRKEYDDHSPPRRRKEDDDHSPPRRRNERDSSPPIKRNERGISPPRNRNERNSSLPSRSSDMSPPRRKRNKTPSSPRNRKEDDDYSPPRRSRNKTPSPPRKRKEDNDYSPPRRKRSDDLSPARKKSRGSPSRFKNKDYSPSRRRRNTPPRILGQKSSDSFRNKSSREPDTKTRKSRWETGDMDNKLKKTLDGKTAGLQNAKDLVKETQSFKKREEELFSNMSVDVSGANAVPIMRDRKTGKVRDLEKEAEVKNRKAREQEAIKEKYDRWGKGVKQVDDYNNKLQEQVYEMSKPLARYADDEDLERYLKEQEREGDPMLAYIRKKKKKKIVESGKPLKPQYEGEFMPNRFGIRPGHRWDGVDRSNGYEKKWFEVQNSKLAQQEEIYKYSTEDM